MRRPSLLAAVAAVTFGLLVRSASAEDAAAKQLDAKAKSVVYVKLVLKMGEHEGNFDQIGTVVDPAGVVMMPNFASPRGGTKITPVSIRVIFPGDEKEYDAVLGAFDSKIGLAFIRVKDLAGKQITSVDLTQTAEAKIGDELFGVTRKDEGFDYAPYYGLAKVVGQVTKPRTMWIANGFQPAAHPMYSNDGKLVGVVIRQEGVSESRGLASIFVLPIAAVQGVITQAIKASAKALEDAKTAEPEGGKDAAGMDGAAMDGAAMDGGMTEPGMEAPDPGMGEAPAGMGEGK